MSRSENCFQGELIMVIKDIAVADAESTQIEFHKHFKRLADESEIITNEQGKKESTFFAAQMYKRGIVIKPYPPLSTESFFIELTATMKPHIEESKVIHYGGKSFLNHMKLIMSKLNISDFAAMNCEGAKIRSKEIRDCLQNAIITGSIICPKTVSFGVTFRVDMDQHLMLLDDDKIITVSVTEATSQIENYKTFIDRYLLINNNINETLTEIIENINDAGIILGKVKSMKFLFEQFNTNIKRNNANFKDWTNLFQLFLDIIYWRRKLRVQKYILDNTQKFENTNKIEIESLMHFAESKLNQIHDKMKICKSQCDECFFLCLSCKNHQDNANWNDEHDCYQRQHSCNEPCEYCKKENRIAQCADKCGHSGKHNCRQLDHTCGSLCKLSRFGGCQQKCNLEFGHGIYISCKCSAEIHYCIEKCEVERCNNTCITPYNVQHDRHICVRKKCPHKCQVKVWDEDLNQAVHCGRDCVSNSHDHQFKMDNDECKDEGHTCDQEHTCSEYCTELGNCREKNRIADKKTFTTGAGVNIEYASYAEVNAEKKRCCKKIPVGHFKHAGSEHKCYDNNLSANAHTCDEKCPECGYFCQNVYNHYQNFGSFHDCVHGNMRYAKFYAAEEIVDIGDNRKYKVGDDG
eukprot:197668_1